MFINCTISCIVEMKLIVVIENDEKKRRKNRDVPPIYQTRFSCLSVWYTWKIMDFIPKIFPVFEDNCPFYSSKYPKRAEAHGMFHMILQLNVSIQSNNSLGICSSCQAFYTQGISTKCELQCNNISPRCGTLASVIPTNKYGTFVACCSIVFWIMDAFWMKFCLFV